MKPQTFIASIIIFHYLILSYLTAHTTACEHQWEVYDNDLGKEGNNLHGPYK